MYLIVQVFYLDLALYFSQFGSPRLMHGVGHICRDDEAFRIVMEPRAICGDLRDGCLKLLEFHRGAPVPIEGRFHDFHHHINRRGIG